MDTLPLFAALTQTRRFVYEGAPSPQITTRVTYKYDKMGNVTGYTDYLTGNAKDSVTVSIGYHHDNTRYIHSVPLLQEVHTEAGLMRRSETTINEYGDITRVSRLISGEQMAHHDMNYDRYGNLTRITRPANYQGERLWMAYEYDSAVHTFITRVTDTFGYESSSAYNYLWGLPIENTDRNGEQMSYIFDNRGRITTVTGPHEIASGAPYTIAFDYHPEAAVAYARTRHYDPLQEADIETFTFSDGLARPVQVKKTGIVSAADGASATEGFIVSGKVLYDAFGRAVSAYQPVFETGSNPQTYNPTPDKVAPTRTTYDVQNRTTKVTLPDGAQTTRGYGIGAYNGEALLIDTITDALGNVSVNITNARGQQVASILKTSDEDVVTAFDYNPVGELLAVTHPNGHKTLSVYDRAGRRVSVNQPDAGLTEFAYDAAGNLTKKVTANLREQMPDGGAIVYKYDFERLSEIVYPRNIQNRVQYSYGPPGAEHGRAGRLTLVQDASGGQEFFYGPLGLVVKTIRTVQLGQADMRTWIWSAGYDTWNRVQSMTYPDGEEVTYQYNRAGNLERMSGEKLGRTYEYISQIGYDKYEKQIYLRYGNGAVTTYDYEPERQRLAHMRVTANNHEMMNNTYQYDAIDNILSIANSASGGGSSVKNGAGMGGSTAHSYSYDELNRLVNASGSYTGGGGNNPNSDYTLDMAYDIMGNILRKNQSHTTGSTPQPATTYHLSYAYTGSQPNAATQIGDRRFTYPANCGSNQTAWEDTLTNDFRHLAWDSLSGHRRKENRLSLISDNGYLNGQQRFEESRVSPSASLWRPREAYLQQLGIPPGPPTMKGIYGEPAYLPDEAEIHRKTFA